MFIFTKHGVPDWSPEEVQVWCAKMRREIDTKVMHPYYLKRRVWVCRILKCPWLIGMIANTNDRHKSRSMRR